MTTRTLGPITYAVRELPADFYGPRFYVEGTRQVGRGEFSVGVGTYYHTREQAERVACEAAR